MDISSIKNISDCFKINGFVELEQCIDQDEINFLINFVKNKYKENNNNYFFLAGDKFDQSFNDNKLIIKKVKNLIEKISFELNLHDKNQELYKVLRVVDGKKSDSEANNYHFDAHYFTVLIPILIPNNLSGKNGDLMISPNFRNYSSNILINIFEKLLYQVILKPFLKIDKFRKFLKFKKIILKVGNIYLFNGYRSLHGNLNIERGNLRATLLVHYNDKFKNSKIVNFNRSLRQYRENKIIDDNKKIKN